MLRTRRHPQPLGSWGEQLSHLHLLHFYYHSFLSPIHAAHMHVGVQILARMWRKKNTYSLLDYKLRQSWWKSMQRFLRKLKREPQSAQLYLSCAGVCTPRSSLDVRVYCCLVHNGKETTSAFMAIVRWVDNENRVHTMEFYPTIKTNEIMDFSWN